MLVFFSSRLKRVLCLVIVFLFLGVYLESKTYETRDEALTRVFGAEARIEQRTIFLKEEEIQSLQKAARAPLARPRVTYYDAYADGERLGRAFLDTHRVRGANQTLMIVLHPDGHLTNLDVLAFHEPEDYLPPRKWFAQLLGKRQADEVDTRNGVQAISGATLSVRASCQAVRRALVINEFLERDQR